MSSPRVQVLVVLALVLACYAAPERVLGPDIIFEDTFPLQPKELSIPVPEPNGAESVKEYRPEEYSEHAPEQPAGAERQARVTYEGAQLWNVPIDDVSKIRIVSNLTLSKEVATWGGNHSAIDFLVKQDKIHKVGQILRDANIHYSIVISDLQKNIDAENPPLSEEDQDLQQRKGHRLTWQQYHRVGDIHGFLDYMAVTYPSICSVMSIGKSIEGRDLKVLRISNGQRTNKAIWIDGGIHAREWISPATVTYIINQFVENYESESDVVRNMDWYFLPVVNPDGYEFSHTTDRLWRKNRRRFLGCSGTDLNRNFGYKWGGKGTSTNKCSEVFAGTSAFSEPESKALADFIMQSSANFKLYVSYHSYGQYILYPWGYDKVVPEDYEDLDTTGNKAAKAILNAGGTPYKVGASSIVLYPAAGASDDWAKAIGNIKYSYTVELSDTGRYGFVLPASFITRVARESLAALRVMAQAASVA